MCIQYTYGSIMYTYIRAHAHRHKYSANLPRSQYNIYLYRGQGIRCFVPTRYVYDTVCATNRQSLRDRSIATEQLERWQRRRKSWFNFADDDVYVLSSRDTVIIIFINDNAMPRMLLIYKRDYGVLEKTYAPLTTVIQYTPLWYAIFQRHMGVTKLLVEHNMNGWIGSA